MQYEVGEIVVHPAHGTGEIVALEEQEVVEGYTKYCVIFFPRKQTQDPHPNAQN